MRSEIAWLTSMDLWVAVVYCPFCMTTVLLVWWLRRNRSRMGRTSPGSAWMSVAFLASRLSRLAEVLGWSKARSVGGVEMHLQMGQQLLGRLEQAVEVVPPPMAGELLLHIAPQALDQIELRRIGGQEERLQSVGIAPPDLAQRMALVVADIVEHDNGRFVSWQRPGEVVQERAEGHRSLPWACLPHSLASRVVDRANDDRFLVLAGGGNLQWLSFTPPDLCQVGVGMDFTLVHVDQMESSGLSSRFFWSQSSTCLAAATAA